MTYLIGTIVALVLLGLVALFLQAVNKFFEFRNMQEERWENEQSDFDAEYPAKFELRD